MKPLRVCIVTAYDLAEEGGVKKHAVHLARQLRRGGDRVTLIGPYSGRAPLGEHVVGFPGVVNIPANGSDNHLGIFVCPYTVRRFFRDQRFDVVHLQEPCSPSLPWWSTWFSAGTPKVATFHAFSENESPRTRLVRRACRPQIQLCDHAIAVSPAAARHARPVWSRRMALIPNGVDTSVFVPAGDSPRAAGPVRLLFVGHWRDPRKGLKTLLRAYAQLRANQVDATLDIVGEGEPGRRPPDEPGVRYHGAINSEERLSALYRTCDVFVAPSTGMESFGIVLLEAMASARSIVCSNIEGYRYVVSEAGARLTPPGDVEALAAALTEVAKSEDLRRQMGDANRAAALRFDWSVLTARVREEYLSVLEARAGRTLARQADRDAPEQRRQAAGIAARSLEA